MVKFFLCRTCGNLVNMITEGGGTLVCCGKEMTELNPNTADAATEKHVPVITVDGNSVNVVVGSALHPMTEDHYIGFIALETNKGLHRMDLDHTGSPEAAFALAEGETAVAAYAYCNLHGLWKAEA